jgi:hypothetical protein
MGDSQRNGENMCKDCLGLYQSTVTEKLRMLYVMKFEGWEGTVTCHCGNQLKIKLDNLTQALDNKAKRSTIQV